MMAIVFADLYWGSPIYETASESFRVEGLELQGLGFRA